MVSFIFKGKLFKMNEQKCTISHALVLPCFEWAYFTPTEKLRDPAHFPLVVDEAALKFAVDALLAMSEGR
jgi:hypothetical protein